MHDPLEGVTPLGTIRTGAGHDRISVVFQPVVDAARVAVRLEDRSSSLYVYGSVATGTAQPGKADVDLLTIGLPSIGAAEIGRSLSRQFSDVCRSVEVAATQPGDFAGEGAEAYGNRVFLRHYCVHVTGSDLHSALPDFPADARAARGFNGDIARHARRWRDELTAGRDPARLGRVLARKSLLAVAGLVSVHDHTWTTNRVAAAARWGEIEPALAEDLNALLGWSSGTVLADAPSIEAALNGVVEQIVAAFRDNIGLWDAAD